MKKSKEEKMKLGWSSRYEEMGNHAVGSLTDSGLCAAFLSWYCPDELRVFMFKLAEYTERMKETKGIIEKFNQGKRVSAAQRAAAYMNLEFVARDMGAVGFAMGFLMGQHFNVKDKELLPRLEKMFFDTLRRTGRPGAEREGLPVIGKPPQQNIGGSYSQIPPASSGREEGQGKPIKRRKGGVE